MRVGFVALLLLLVNPASACGLAQAERVAVADDLFLDYRFEPTPVEVAREFNLLLQLCRDDSEVAIQDLRLDASMPAHGHGMNYRPAISARPAGGYRAAGMLFHMPGSWRIALGFEHGGGRQEVLLDIEL